MRTVRVLMMSMLLAIITIGVSSCTEERFGSVVGCWELESDEYGYVEDVMVDKYYFYADGTGTYGYYDRDAYGYYWVGDVPFSWGYGWDGPESIWMDFGYGGRYYYYYECDGPNLVLSKDPYFRTWLNYVRSY